MTDTSKHRPPSWLANLPGRYKILLAVVPLLGLFLLTSIATLVTLRHEAGTRHLAQHAYAVLAAVDQVRETSQLMVIGARGYMSSGDTAERLAYEQGRRDFAAGLAALRDLATGNATQQVQIDHIQDLATRWQHAVDTKVIAPLQAQPGGDPAQAAVRRAQLAANYRTTSSVRGADVAAALGRMAKAQQTVLTARNLRADTALRLLLIFTALAALSGMVFGAYVICASNRLITVPLRQITDMMNRVAKRDTRVVVTRLRRADEIGELARALQVFKETAASVNDQTWVKSQLAAVSQHLQEATTHREFAQALTALVAPLVHAGVALYYLHDSTHQRLELLGSYGLQESWGTADPLAPGEGLVGQCLLDRQSIELDNLPTDYVQVHSGSGQAPASHLLILPVIHREAVIGVLELAGFTAPSPVQRELLHALLPLLALTQENLTRAVNTQDLLERTRLQAEDLRVSELLMRQQKAVLHDNNAALQAKTDELESSQRQLRQQAEQLRASNTQLRDQAEHLDRQHAVLEELQQETAEKADQLARSSQYKSEFLANMSHELRTPLNSLLILSRNLADNARGNLDAEQVESAHIIHDAGSSLLTLINDILDLSKIEAGRMEPVMETVLLGAFAQRLRRVFAHVASERQLDFNVTVAPDLPPSLRTDGVRLEQIANNLLSNACKFTRRGGVDVTLALAGTDADDTPAALRGQPLLTLTVADTGIGIPADKLQRVFNAFEQVDAGTSRQFGGTGLGLTISQRLARLLGGELTVSSEPGAGSRFVVWLPLVPGTDAATPDDDRTTPPSPDAPPPAANRAATILVVEDDTALAHVLAGVVKAHGHDVLLAHDGTSAVQLARAHHPDGVLLDISLPAIDGWAVLAALRERPDTAAIPVHFISASDEARRAMAAGAVGFLLKPVTREAVAEALERLLAHRPQLAGQCVLLVDDDMRNLFALAKTLRDWGLHVLMASNGRKALDTLAEHAGIQLVLMDIMMPVMDGYTAISLIRSQATLATLPIIALTAKAMPGDRERCLEAGASDYLTKPVDLDQLALALHRWLGARIALEPRNA